MCKSNRRQCDPPDQRHSQKPVVPSCLVKETLQKIFEVEQPANIPPKNPPS